MLINLSLDSAKKIFKGFAHQGNILSMIEKSFLGSCLQLSNGAVVVMEKCKNPLMIVGGELNDTTVGEIISLISSYEDPIIYCQPEYNHLFLPYGWNFHLRISLKINNPKLYPINDDLTVRTIQEWTDFSNCRWYNERIELYGSEENLLKNGRGYLLCRSDEVLCEIYPEIGGNHAEFNIITHPHHRGKGYGFMLGSYVIRQLISEKLTPEWCCRADNIASLNLALKLGFKVNKYYLFMVKKYGNVFCKNFEQSPDPDYAV